MEEKTGIWIKRNGKLEKCMSYYELRNILNTDCKIHIYRKDGHGIRFVVEEVLIRNDCVLLDLLPFIELNPKDLKEKYRVINFAFENKNVDKLRIEKPICWRPENDMDGLFLVKDTSADYSFWKDYEDTSLYGLKIVVIPRSERINNMKKMANNYFGNMVNELQKEHDMPFRGHRVTMPVLESTIPTETFDKLKQVVDKPFLTFMNQGGNNMRTLKNKIKKVIYVDKPLTVNHKTTDKDGNEVIKSTKYNGMVKVFWTDGTETIAYTNVRDKFNKEEGFKTCVMKYVFGNAEAYESVDFWTNKYVKYPSSCIEVTEALCKLEKIIRKDAGRSKGQKGLTYVKFFRETGLLGKYLSEYKQCHKEHISEFKKLAKKYFPEMKGKEIYINSGRKDETFVAIK